MKQRGQVRQEFTIKLDDTQQELQLLLVSRCWCLQQHLHFFRLYFYTALVDGVPEVLKFSFRELTFLFLHSYTLFLQTF